MSKFKLSTISFMCIGFNLLLNILGFLITVIPFSITSGNVFRSISQVILLGNIALPVLVSFGGAILGIGSFSLKEKPILKAIITLALNIIYIRGYFLFWTM